MFFTFQRTDKKDKHKVWVPRDANFKLKFLQWSNYGAALSQACDSANPKKILLNESDNRAASEYYQKRFVYIQ